MRPGFKKADLTPRYDVPHIREDEWHLFSGFRTNEIVATTLTQFNGSPCRLLNAGAGCYKIEHPDWDEVSIDLFTTPLGARGSSVCGNIQSLPFRAATFGCVVCVGEVLAYCDPASAISEFARVLADSGILICDFGNSMSARYGFTDHYGRAADLVTDNYNGSPEKIWIYSPDYIREILHSNSFEIVSEFTLGPLSPRSSGQNIVSS